MSMFQNFDGIQALTGAELEQVAGGCRRGGNRGPREGREGHRLEAHDGHLDVIIGTGRRARRYHLTELTVGEEEHA